MTDLGPKPELLWLDEGLLDVESEYQRDTTSAQSVRLISRITKNFRWARFGVILVVRRDSRYVIIDGQHRVKAVRRRGDIKLIPCCVLPHATVREAALDFVAVNADRVRVSSIHLYHAKLAAADPAALMVNEVCKAAALKVPRSLNVDALKPGQVTAVVTIETLCHKLGKTHVIAVLRLLASAYFDRVNAIRSDFIKAVSALLLKGADSKGIVDVLRGVDQRSLIYLASKVDAASISVAIAMFIDEALKQRSRLRPEEIVDRLPQKHVHVNESESFLMAIDYLEENGHRIVTDPAFAGHYIIGDLAGCSALDIIVIVDGMKEQGLGAR